jgi:hypothetical protein
VSPSSGSGTSVGYARRGLGRLAGSGPRDGSRWATCALLDSTRPRGSMGWVVGGDGTHPPAVERSAGVVPRDRAAARNFGDPVGRWEGYAQGFWPYLCNPEAKPTMTARTERPGLPPLVGRLLPLRGYERPFIGVPTPAGCKPRAFCRGLALGPVAGSRDRGAERRPFAPAGLGAVCERADRRVSLIRRVE